MRYVPIVLHQLCMVEYGMEMNKGKSHVRQMVETHSLRVVSHKSVVPELGGVGLGVMSLLDIQLQK